MPRIALLFAAWLATSAALARDIDGDPRCASDAFAAVPSGDINAVADHRNALIIRRSPGGATRLATRGMFTNAGLIPWRDAGRLCHGRSLPQPTPARPDDFRRAGRRLAARAGRTLALCCIAARVNHSRHRAVLNL